MAGPFPTRCAVCRKSFDARTRSARYCSDACRRFKYKRPDAVTRTCPECQEEFVATFGAIRCSQECRAAHNKRRADGRARYFRHGNDWAGYLMGEPCVYCGAQAQHLDHIEPLALGGADNWSNLVPACATCNTSKGVDSALVFMLRRAQRKEENSVHA